jgi:hypothetical protein
MRTMGGFVVAVGLLSTALLTNPSPGLAQSCEALPVDGSPTSYRYRADPPRCEGIYRSPVSGNPGMALVSLTYGGVTYDPGRDQDLEISLPVEPAEKTLIRGVGVPERLYYRLDAELDANHTAFKLPLADVIARDRQLVPEALGLYGYRMLPGGQTAFVPVSARSPATGIGRASSPWSARAATCTTSNGASIHQAEPLRTGFRSRAQAASCPKEAGSRSCFRRSRRRPSSRSRSW